MRKVLPRVGLKLMANLVSRIGSPIKFLPISLRRKRIGSLTLGPKREEVEIHLVRNLIVPSAVKSIRVNSWWEWVIALVVENMAIRLNIVL